MPTVFVAYPYRIPAEEFRQAFDDARADLDVRFEYADERITNKHVLDKIVEMIGEADLSLFDITHWNPNVTLELGVAMGRGFNYFILWNPNVGDKDEPPADLGGIDRVQYTSYEELTAKVRRLLEQQFGTSGPPKTTRDAGSALVALGVEEFWRQAKASRDDRSDLQVVYLRVRNNRPPGEGATIRDATVHVSAFEGENRVLHASGNWIDLSAGHPNPIPTKRLSLAPRDEAGIELVGKFHWQRDAYLAGQSDPPSLPMGVYKIRVEATDQVSELGTFEWLVYNYGADRSLAWAKTALTTN